MSEEALFLFMTIAAVVAILGLVGMTVAGFGLLMSWRRERAEPGDDVQLAAPEPPRRAVPTRVPLNLGPPPKPPSIDLPLVYSGPPDYDDDEPTELMTADKLELLLAQLETKSGPGRVVAKD